MSNSNRMVLSSSSSTSSGSASSDIEIVGIPTIVVGIIAAVKAKGGEAEYAKFRDASDLEEGRVLRIGETNAENKKLEPFRKLLRRLKGNSTDSEAYTSAVDKLELSIVNGTPLDETSQSTILESISEGNTNFKDHLTIHNNFFKDGTSIEDLKTEWQTFLSANSDIGKEEFLKLLKLLGIGENIPSI